MSSRRAWPRTGTIVGLLTLAVVVPDAGTTTHAGTDPVAVRDTAIALPNDNRTPAGHRQGASLSLHLVARAARVQPEGPQGPTVSTFAFAEESGAPTVPGPLIRVPVGTVVDVTVRNELPKPLRVHGLNDWPSSAPATIELAPSQSRRLRLRANAPGTYLYWGRTTTDTFAIGLVEDGLLTGAVVVDSVESRGGIASSDRVFVMGIWKARSTPPGTPVEQRQEALMFNGRAWPHSERLSATVGDTLRWRVVNATRRMHPMHLHGFYYRIDARGSPARDTIYAPPARRMVVTEDLAAGASMSLAWSPSRSGNWLFHCHNVEHISGRVVLRPRNAASAHAHQNHALEGMTGLVLGITANPRSGMSMSPPGPARRTLRVIITQRANVFDSASALSFVWQEGVREPAPDSVLIPGSTLRLVRGEPTAITVVNRAREPVSVHWHGIELESFYDGVSGWSGAGTQVAPQIAPGDSFVVRITPVRAGTFIYHTHFEETRQLGSGLFAPLIVDPPGVTPDTSRERVFVLGAGGPSVRALPSFNGQTTPQPIELRAGVTYRLRVISIAANDGKIVRLLAGSALQQWRPVAKDGADLPAHQSMMYPARVSMGMGETWDFEYTPVDARDLTLEITTTGRVALPPVVTHVPVRVLPPAR